jgi:hypothetical protein
MNDLQRLQIRTEGGRQSVIRLDLGDVRRVTTRRGRVEQPERCQPRRLFFVRDLQTQPTSVLTLP